MMRLLLTAWVLVVGAAVVANAQDSSMELQSNLVLAPVGCNIKAATVVRLHTELCKSDAECTQRLLDTMCVLSTVEVMR